MSIQIIKKNEQAFGSFNNGKIIENKPIGFPQDRGMVKPYSNLFYWANASTESGGLIDEHPHKFFEIMSFVLEGEIEHFDNKYNRWLKLKDGDVQIIRAGNGIVHAENMLPKSRIFQIWFDPNIKHTQNQAASYNDYKKEDFKTVIIKNLEIINYAGNDGIVQMETKGVNIKKIKIQPGKNSIALHNDKITSVYVLKSTSATLNKTPITTDDFIILKNESEIIIESDNITTFFIIENPINVEYTTYIEMVKF